MVNALILLSLAEEDVMSKVLDYFKQSLYLVLLCIFIGFILLEFPTICAATHKLLDRADSLNSVEIASVKISFNSENVAAAFSELKMDGVEPAKQGSALDLIHGLEQNEFVRLMYVGQLTNLCDYDAPADTKMRYDVATDYKLVEKNLAEMIEDPDLLRQQTEYVNQQIARTGHSDNGHPFHCYILRLTADGANVKTALVGSFGEAFKRLPAKAIPSDQLIATK
jgi:hypothetical protein